MKEREPRWHFWKSKQNDSWLRGRAHLYHHSQGLISHLLGPFRPRKIVEAGLEWVIGAGSNSASATLHLGVSHFSDGSDRNVTMILQVPWLLGLYLTIDGLLPSWALPNSSKHGGREFGLQMHDGKIWVHLWAPGNGDWSSTNPRWWDITIDPVEVVFGKETRKISNKDLGRFEIPLPEGVYTAKIQDSTCEATFARWPWSKQVWRSFSFDEIRGPKGEDHFPVPGKGESDWDLGDDGIYACGASGGQSLGEAVGEVVGKVLRTRLRYGGRMNWVPDAVQKSP